jgi:hypothetical protein
MELLARTCKSEQMNTQRILARFFVVLGAVFTFWMMFGAEYTYKGSPLAFAAGYAMIFTIGVLLVFVVGLFFENLAAILLVLGAIAIIVWGSIAAWSPGTWGILTFLFLLPMIASAALYSSAARMQKICEMK